MFLGSSFLGLLNSYICFVDDLQLCCFGFDEYFNSAVFLTVLFSFYVVMVLIWVFMFVCVVILDISAIVVYL